MNGEVEQPPAQGLVLRLFGAMQLSVDGHRCEGRLRAKARWLLALLAGRRGEATERAGLAAQLWPDSLEERALYNLRRELSVLRKVLGAEAGRLRAVGARSIALRVEGAWVDRLRFDAAIERGGQAALREAVALYAGPYLEGCLEEWVLPVRREYEAACLRAIDELVDTARHQADSAAVEALLRRSLEIDPLREGTHRSWIELLAGRGEYAAAVEAYRQLRSLLRRELGVDPDPTTAALFQRVRAESRQAAANRPLAGGPGRGDRPELPVPLTAMIGRVGDRDAVMAKLAEGRLVTLTGTAGVGKTRLALEIARLAAESLEDGAALVDLTALGDPKGLPQAVAGALGVRAAPGSSLSAATRSYLRGRRLLLVVDNCEHLVEACAAEIGALLRALPELKVLATSRQSLGIVGETVWSVEPLAVPGAGEREPAAVLACEAAQLFVARATEALPTFAVDAAAVTHLVEICTRLEGVPLGLELAAARARSFTIAEIAGRLDSLLRDAPGRRSVEAALDWSHDLLAARERVAFRRLSVCEGSFDLATAAAVCGGDGLDADEVADLLDRLRDRSLVHRHASGAEGSRFRLLETVRRYGRRRLVDSGEEAAVRDRHLDCFLALAERAAPHLFGGALDGEWPRRLDRSIDDLRAAAAHAGQAVGGTAKALRLASAMQWYWFAVGSFREGRALLEQALALPGAAPPGIRARAQAALAYLAYWEGDHPAMVEPAAESFATYRAIGEEWGIAYAGSVLAWARLVAGDPAAAVAVANDALTAARRAGDPTLICIALWWQGTVLEHRDDAGAAYGAFAELLDAIREVGHPTGIGHALYPLGRLALARGDLDEAAQRFGESFAVLVDVGNRWGAMAALRGLLQVAAARERHHDAARLLGAVEALRDDLAAEPATAELEQEGRIAAKIGAAVGSSALAAGRNAGKAAVRASRWPDLVGPGPG